MNIKNVIGLVKGCGLNVEPASVANEAERIIISALEKQIPKKPIKTPDNHKWFCPTCHNPIRLGRISLL